jgi:hypothetical protein
MDALGATHDEVEAEMSPEFAAALRRSKAQAQSGDTVDLQSFRATIGR